MTSIESSLIRGEFRWKFKSRRRLVTFPSGVLPVLNEVHAIGGSFFSKRAGMPIFERTGRLGVRNRRGNARPPGRDFALEESALDHGVFGLRLEHEGASGRKGSSEHVEDDAR